MCAETPAPLHTSRLVKVTKLDAARRQLATAITLWFANGDEVSVYTLSHAAYEVIHNLTGPKRQRDLLFDTLVIKDEYRKDFNTLLRKPANFFKHASRGKAEDQPLEFHPEISEGFFFFSLLGLELADTPLNDEESAFAYWQMLHEPRRLTEEGREFLSNALPGKALDQVRALSKQKFFKTFMALRKIGQR